ncbi:unnamed protein product [Chondrus crispus]|uniref:Uncharacterized protein n=1 Tax=Chondrus crispus TaxID=2769 RepID=R7QIP2_CHOCR|nr:unnamed protein product [Chondrus crispus]CDF37346.1 unnamed protein product [Chondrus crispus]|eukprot:XP_005717165.1 unnamed protein product [Chondrus crispus]
MTEVGGRLGRLTEARSVTRRVRTAQDFSRRRTGPRAPSSRLWDSKNLSRSSRTTFHKSSVIELYDSTP